jgi:hypothetical protein
MQALFTYGGNRKSGITPNTILFGAYLSTKFYDANNDVGLLPLSPSDAARLIESGDVDAIRSSIAALTDYEAKVRSYYDARVSRTSGGKRDRLRSERAELTSAALEATTLLKSGLLTLERKIAAQATAKQDDYNPATGKPLTVVEKEIIRETEATKQASFNPNSLIIPVGAALAALFFLKGH